MRHILVLLFVSASLSAAERRVIFPPGAKPVGPYSPGLFVGDFLYVSGQGARQADGKIPASPADQVRQSLENVKSIIDAAGLTMEHIVYTQVYLHSSVSYDDLNRAWTQVFPKNPPARATLGVYRMPVETPVEVNAVAVRDLARKKAVVPPGYPANAPIAPAVMAGERLYLSGFLGRDINTGKIPDEPAVQVQLALDRMKQTLAATDKIGRASCRERV